MGEYKFEGPRGVTKLGNKGKGKIVWDKNFSTKIKGKLAKAQSFIDSEALRYMQDYMPKATGTLINTAIINTVPGSGEICGGNTPYAKQQYANNKGNKREPLRGSKWFERMKADKKEIILRGAAKIIRGAI